VLPVQSWNYRTKRWAPNFEGALKLSGEEFCGDMPNIVSIVIYKLNIKKASSLNPIFFGVGRTLTLKLFSPAYKASGKIL